MAENFQTVSPKLSGESELATNRGFKSWQVETNEPRSGHLVPPGHTVGCPLGIFQTVSLRPSNKSLEGILMVRL